MSILSTRLARGVAALFALAVMTATAVGQTTYTINPGGSVTLSSADQSGLCGGDMSNRNVSFSHGTLYVWGSSGGGSPVSTFKTYIDGGNVVYTHNGDGATQVIITIDGDGCGGSRTMTININQTSSAPAITLQPLSVTMCEGPNIILRSAASGSPPPTAQWQRSTDAGVTWIDEPLFQGRTTDTLLMSSSIGLSGWRFRNVYTNANGSDTTDEAIITTQQNYVLSDVPDTTVCTGTSVTYAPAVVGVGTPTYQWEVSVGGGDYTAIAGETTQTLVVATDPSLHGNRYRLTLTNGACGTSATNGGLLTVNYPPTVTSSPSTQSLCAGQSASFTVASDARPTATSQWQTSTDGGTSWSNVAGATATTLSFTAATTHDGHRFRAIVTNTCGIDTSDAATLSVGSAPTITSHPASITICTGHSTTLSVSAVALGSSPISYQWRKDGSDLTGETDSTLTIADATTASAGSYDVVVTACSASSTSNAAVVTVAPAPTLSVALSRSLISSSAHALVPITATVSASGGCSPAISLDAITSSEADAGVVAGDLAGDIVADSLDLTPAETAFSLRAEAGAAGRVYSVIYRIVDGAYEARDTSLVIALPATSTVASGPESTGLTLTEASPNPASTSSTFSFASPGNCAARVSIYTPSGLLVKTLLVDYFGTGTSITWDLTNIAGTKVAAGIYIYQVKSCGGRRSGAIIVQ
jgi:hypothetical protein